MGTHHFPQLSSPHKARAFHELRRYHTRPLRFNWGPENVHFRKTQFWNPNINVRKNLKNYQAQLFYVLSFPLGYLKMAQKMVQSSKNAEKLPKSLLHISDIAYKDKSSGKIPFLKKLTFRYA